MEKQWFEYPVRVIGINLWAPEWYYASITKFDAEKVADYVKDASANVCFTFQGFTQDHYGLSYFPTIFGPTHKSLGKRDHIKEYIGALHKRDIKIFGYYSFQWDNVVWKQNPDWRQKDKDGRDIVHGDGSWGLLCFNSPYHDHILARIEEIVKNYEIDGLLLDTVEFSTSPLGCYCPYCQRKFREMYGKYLPKEKDGYDKDWQTFLEFRYRSIEELISEVRDIVKAIRPQCVLTHNAFALWHRIGFGSGEDYEKTLKYDDVVTSIHSWITSINGKQARYIDTIWEMGFRTKFLRGLSGGKPVWMQMGRFPYGRDYQVLPTYELKLGAYSIITNGGSPFYIDNLYPDGTVDPMSSERMGEVLSEVREKAEYLDYDEELPFVAVYFSKKSQDYSDSALSEELQYLYSFEGACKILIEAHIPYQIIGEDGLTLENLSKFKILILPNTIILSEDKIRIIKDFVRDGGSCIATFKTSLIDEEGVPRVNFGLSELFGVDYIAPLNYYISFIKPQDNIIFRDIDKRENIPYRGVQLKVKAKNNGKVFARLGLPATEVVGGIRWFSFNPSDVPMEKISEFPTIVVSEFDKGKCVYFSGDITRVYGLYGYPSLRKMFVNAIKLCCESLPVEVGAPLGVESNCFIKDDRLIIHLLNYNISYLRMVPFEGGPLAEEGIPCRDVKIKLSLDDKVPKRIFLVPSGAELNFVIKEGRIYFTVPEVNVHQLVIVEFEK